MIQHLKTAMDKLIQYYQTTVTRVYGYVQTQRHLQVHKHMYICTGVSALGK